MKQVLNTLMNNISGTGGAGGTDPDAEKFIWWGFVESLEAIGAPEVRALQNNEQRADRLKTFTNFASGGGYMTVAIPVAYGGEGKFRDENAGFTYPFTLVSTVTVTDPNQNTYSVNVYCWTRKSSGTIASLVTL